MRKTTFNTINEAINAETRQQVRNTLDTLRAAIYRRIDARDQILDGKTGYQLYLSMRGARFVDAWDKRHALYKRNDEDGKIITLINRELAKL